MKAASTGVYYREFPKVHGFSGDTVLASVHPHLLVPGMAMFPLTALFTRRTTLEEYKSYKTFPVAYNAGVILSAVLMLVRSMKFSNGLSISISGIAGIDHALAGVGSSCC